MLCQLINDRFCFSSEHSYFVVDSKTWKHKLDRATEKGLKYREKYYNSNKRLKRVKEEIMSLQQMLSEPYEKFTIDQEKQHHISNAADLIPSKLFKKALTTSANMANLFENLH